MTGVSLDRPAASVPISGTVKLLATVSPDGADQSVTWSSSNTAVATVSGGMVTIKPDAVVGQNTTITATSKSDPSKTATSIITVAEA